jgi:parallel beta-helix repeat protein
MLMISLIGIVIFLLPITAGNHAEINVSTSEFSSRSEGGWLYVGGSEPGNYTSIQDALDNASAGDTIFVYSGLYGSILINKSITLIGENKATTILNGTVGSRLIFIKADNVIIKDFTIQHMVIGGTGISLQLHDNVTLSNLIITGCNYGLYQNQDKNIFLDNITFEKNNYGIELFCPRNLTSSHCSFIDNNYAIDHKGSSGYGDASVVINGCNFSNNTYGINLNELCTEAKCPTTIEGNTFYHNEYGLVTFDSQVTIRKNNFIGNSQHVALFRESQIILIPHYINRRQHWEGNYWDNWNSGLPCPLRGTWVLFVWPGLFYQFLHFPFVEFDWKPATSPNILN